MPNQESYSAWIEGEAIGFFDTLDEAVAEAVETAKARGVEALIVKHDYADDVHGANYATVKTDGETVFE